MKEMEYKKLAYGGREILDSGEYKGFKYWIISYGTHPCAYVEIPLEHCAFGRQYHKPPICDIDCHGGVTYTEHDLILPDETIDESWFIGWDYSHYGDYIEIVSFIKGKKWTTAEMLEDVHSVIEQLEKMKA